MAYSTSTASYMNSPPKSPIVTSDKYQVTLTVIRRNTVHIIKANVWSIAHQFSHCLVDDMLLQSDHAAIRCRFRSATSSMGVL